MQQQGQQPSSTQQAPVHPHLVEHVYQLLLLLDTLLKPGRAASAQALALQGTVEGLIELLLATDGWGALRHAWMRVHVSMHVCMDLPACMYVCACKHACMCVHVSMHVCVCM